MLRIDPSIALDVELNGNGLGKHAFQAGDPQTGREATQCPVQWLNAVQETLCRAIEEGLGPLDANNPLQLLELIKKMAWGDGQTSAPWIKRYPSGSTVPTVYTGDVIYIGTNKYEWIDGAYVQIKPIVARTSIYATNTASSLSVTVNAPKAGVLYFTGNKNVSTYTGTNGYQLDMFINGSVVSSDNCSHSIANSVAIDVGAGTQTILLAGNHVSSYSMWLSVLYIPN